MNRDGAAGPRWLESLARRAARGQVAPLPIDNVSVADPSHGISRRTVLRSAAGAALVAGPLRFLNPASAHAASTSLQDCNAANFKRTHDAFQACVKDPLDALDAAQSTIADTTDHLAHLNEVRPERRAAARKRLQKNLARATRERDRAIKQLENCNFKWLNEQAAGESDCQTANPPIVKSPVGGGSGGGGGGGAGCDQGYILCGDYCCNLSYATCVGCNGTPICCRINGSCCPSGG